MPSLMRSSPFVRFTASLLGTWLDGKTKSAIWESFKHYRISDVINIPELVLEWTAPVEPSWGIRLACDTVRCMVHPKALSTQGSIADVDVKINGSFLEGAPRPLV
jgi:hypothetical protein